MHRLRKNTFDYAGFYVALFALLVAVFAPPFWSWRLHLLYEVLSYLLFCVLYLGSITIIMVRLVGFNRYTQSVNSLLVLYFELLAIFASIYMWLYLLHGAEAFRGFGPLDRSLFDTRDGFDFFAYLPELGQVLVDAVHFSIVTGTTLGYGDMVPVHWTVKLLVDVQVLLTVGVVVLGYGHAGKSKGAPPETTNKE